MSKKTAIILVLLLAASVGGAVFYNYSRESSIRKEGTLSGRAKEYLSKRSQADQIWKTVNFNDPDKPQTKGAATGTVKVGNCFSIAIPITVLQIKTKGDCFTVFATESPKGNIRAYQQTGYGDVNGVSDVSMRRKYPEKYTERQLINHGSTVLIFRANDPNMYDSVAFYVKNNRLIIVSMQYPTGENLDTIMDKVVMSVSLLQ